MIDTAWSKLKQTLATSDDFEGTCSAIFRRDPNADKVCEHHSDYVLLQRIENTETYTWNYQAIEEFPDFLQ